MLIDILIHWYALHAGVDIKLTKECPVWIKHVLDQSNPQNTVMGNRISFNYSFILLEEFQMDFLKKLNHLDLLDRVSVNYRRRKSSDK